MSSHDCDEHLTEDCAWCTRDELCKRDVEIKQLREQNAQLQATIERKDAHLRNIVSFTSIDLIREAAKAALRSEVE